jgi:Zn-dependent protease with chaperone function
VILPYALRLLCVCLASFFLVHLVLAALARALAPWALWRAERIGASHPARSAALLLLAVRLFPAVVALATVAALCVPSFLSFEREHGSEAIGIPFLALAALGACAWAISLARSVRALIRSHRCLPLRTAMLADESEAVWLLDGPAPFVGLTGVLRPRIVATRSVTRALDSDQLAAALRHERAHRESADNLKRLLFLLAPEALPGVAWFRAVDRAWARFAEWAADDWAVAQDADCSVSLAEALVRVARLGAAPQASPLVSPFVPAGDDISSRVDRLLNRRTPASARFPMAGRAIFAALAALPFVAAAADPGSLRTIHELLERLMH